MSRGACTLIRCYTRHGSRPSRNRIYMEARVTILPAKDPSPVLTRHGLSLKSWPRHKDGVVRWPTLPLTEALATRFPVDAMALMYYDAAAEDRRCWRYSTEVLDMPEADHIYLTCVFVDLDTAGEHSRWTDQSALDRSVEALTAAIPIGWYSTRGGIRGVGICPEIVPIRLARDYLRTWHSENSTRMAPLLADLGLEWDHSGAEWQRMFRLPFVTRSIDPKLDVIDSPNGPVWIGKKTWEPVGGELIMRQEFSFLILPGAPDPTVTQSAPDHVIHLRQGDRPEPMPAKPEGWEAWVSDGSIAGRRKDLLTGGKPWGAPEINHGERNTTIKGTLNSLAAQLWRHQPARPTAAELYAIMGPSVLAELHRDRDAPTLEDLWRLCSFTSTLEVDRRERAAPPDLSIDGGFPPLVAHGDGVGFVFDATKGQYLGPLKGSDLYIEISNHIQIPVKRATGTTMRPMTEILQTHAIRANHVELCYPGLGRGEPWDAGTKTLRVEVFEDPHDIEPCEHPEVGEWLWHMTFGNPPAICEAFLDWIATCPYLQFPTAALYLDGPKAAGKGMFASGIASLWRRGRVNFKEAIQKHNAGLVSSPVVFLDEEQEMGKAESGAFRSMIAETEHRIEPKGHEVFTLYGSPRNIMAANHGNLIRLAGSHGSKDLAALIDRILHINVSDTAARFLADLGGRPATQDWVINARGNPGRIAEHVAWLHQIRGEAYVREGRGGRFLVTGVRTDYHTKLITSDPLYGQILVAIACAMAPATGTGGGIGVVCDGDGIVSVNPRMLHERWRLLVNEDSWRPSLQDVATALEGISGMPYREYGVAGAMATHWPIPGDLVLRVARDVGHSGVERIRRVLVEGMKAGDAPIKRKGGMFGGDRIGKA